MTLARHPSRPAAVAPPVIHVDGEAVRARTERPRNERPGDESPLPGNPRNGSPRHGSARSASARNGSPRLAYRAQAGLVRVATAAVAR
jgi:hypothetical protein